MRVGSAAEHDSPEELELPEDRLEAIVEFFAQVILDDLQTHKPERSRVSNRLCQLLGAIAGAEALLITVREDAELSDQPPGGGLLSLKLQPGWLTPRFQLNDDGRPIPLVPEINNHLQAEAFPWEALDWWLTPVDEDQTRADWLDETNAALLLESLRNPVDSY